MTFTVVQDSSMTLLDRLYHDLLRLRDLWIVLVWGGVLAAIFLNTFYHRDCYEFVVVQNVTATCQSTLDLAFVFLAAVGAGATIRDESYAIAGFLFAHIEASIIFLSVLFLPPYLAGADPALLSAVASQSFGVALGSQFPFAIFLSLIGTLVGLYVGSKLPDSESAG